MREEYDELVFYALKIDEYLGIEGFESDNSNINNMIEISKACCAETMFAYETQAIYWNVFRSGVGVEILKKLNKNLI